jgi:hypothetical protein
MLPHLVYEMARRKTVSSLDKAPKIKIIKRPSASDAGPGIVLPIRPSVPAISESPESQSPPEVVQPEIDDDILSLETKREAKNGYTWFDISYEELTWIQMMESVWVVDGLSLRDVQKMFEAEFGWTIPKEWRAISNWMKENPSFKRQLVGFRPLLKAFVGLGASSWLREMKCWLQAPMFCRDALFQSWDFNSIRSVANISQDA